jgi:hypothetical protein
VWAWPPIGLYKSSSLCVTRLSVPSHSATPEQSHLNRAPTDTQYKLRLVHTIHTAHSHSKPPTSTTMTTYINWVFFDSANKDNRVHRMDVSNTLDESLRDLEWDAELKSLFKLVKFRAGGIHFWRVC